VQIIKHFLEFNVEIVKQSLSNTDKAVFWGTLVMVALLGVLT